MPGLCVNYLGDFGVTTGPLVVEVVNAYPVHTVSGAKVAV
jgi:hypothetical protein